IWSKIIEWPDDDCRNVVGGPIRVNQAIGTTLRRGIRTHRVERVLLIHLLGYCCAVDFRSGDMDEAINPIAMLGDSVGDRLRTEHISLEEKLVVVDRTSHV